MAAGPLVVTYALTGRSRAIVEEELGGTAEAIYTGWQSDRPGIRLTCGLGVSQGPSAAAAAGS
jgi:hypothetical protein